MLIGRRISRHPEFQLVIMGSNIFPAICVSELLMKFTSRPTHFTALHQWIFSLVGFPDLCDSVGQLEHVGSVNRKFQGVLPFLICESPPSPTIFILSQTFYNLPRICYRPNSVRIICFLSFICLFFPWQVKKINKWYFVRQPKLKMPGRPSRPRQSRASRGIISTLSDYILSRAESCLPWTSRGQRATLRLSRAAATKGQVILQSHTFSS